MLNAFLSRLPGHYRVAAGAMLAAVGIALLQSRVDELLAQVETLSTPATDDASTPPADDASPVDVGHVTGSGDDASPAAGAYA